MLAAALSWIPVVGPILQGFLGTASTIFSTFSNIYGKKKDAEIAVVGAKIAGINADVETARIGAQIIATTNDDISLRIIRDIALVPPVIWSAIIGWDTIIALRYPHLMFHVVDYPVNVQYIPYGAFAFLFGVLGMNIWKRK